MEWYKSPTIDIKFLHKQRINASLLTYLKYFEYTWCIWVTLK